MRKSYGLTQGEMAEMLCMSRENYGRIERGQTSISPEKFQEYVKLFSRELFNKTGYLLDERFTVADIAKYAVKVIKNIFGIK